MRVSGLDVDKKYFEVKIKVRFSDGYELVFYAVPQLLASGKLLKVMLKGFFGITVASFNVETQHLVGNGRQLGAYWVEAYDYVERNVKADLFVLNFFSSSVAHTAWEYIRGTKHLGEQLRLGHDS